MRLPLIVLALTTASSMRVCESKDDGAAGQDPPKATATAEGQASGAAAGKTEAAAALEAQIGGQMVAVGDHQVELKLYREGFAEALVYDASGKLLEKPAEAKLLVRAKAEGEAKEDIRLAYDPAVARFAAEAGADASLEPGPVELELTLGADKKAEGKLEAAVLLVGPEIGGTLAVAGDHGVEVAADADGNVEALVHDAAGARVEGDADARVNVELTGADGKLHAVACAWNDAKARFTGKLDADAKLAAGPAKLGLAGKAQAKLPKLALRGKAKANGRVILAGDYSVELVAKGGMIHAHVFDASGQAYAKGDLDLNVKLGAGAFVKLAWDAPSLSYRAKFDGKLDLNVQPVIVSLKANGKAHVGASLQAKAKAKGKAKLEGPNLQAKVDLAPKAKADAKAKAGAKGSVKAPSVKVSAPKVDVKKSASASAGSGAKASAGFSFGSK